MMIPKWVIKEVKANEDFTLNLTFADGTRKTYDAHPLLNKSMYYKLKNISFFTKAKVKYGTVVWDDDVDIAPEHLYHCSKTSK